MKKIMLFLICTAGLLSMCMTCNDYNYHEGRWYIKNCTDQTLILAHRTYLKRISYRDLAPEDSVKIQTSEFRNTNGETPYFDFPFIYWSRPEEGYSVLSKDSVLLKEWRWGEDNKFFNESYWHYYERQGMSYDKPNIVATWVFDVLPEDIVQKP